MEWIRLMEVKAKRFWIVFLIVIIINLTPAFATELSGLADQAKNYNEESKQEMGFFAKAKFMAKGYQLVNKAEEASAETEKIENQTETLGDKYDALVNKTNKNTENRLIGEIYRNRDNITINDTNTTKADILASIQLSLKDNANNMVNALANQNMTMTLIDHPSVDSNLNNNIVQIVTRGGYIRYVLVKSVDPKNNTVNYSKNGDTDSVMSLDEFRKSYTGIIIKIKNPNIKTVQVLAQIEKQYKNDLDDLQNTAKEINKKTKTEMIHKGIILALSIVVMIIGCILATWFSKAATTTLQTTENAASSESKKVYNAEQFHVGDQFNTGKDGVIELVKKEPAVNFLNEPTTVCFFKKKCVKFDVELILYEECFNKYLNLGHVTPLSVAATSAAVAVPAGVAGTSAAEGALETVATASTQNYIATVVKIIGILLIIGGLVGLIISTYLLIYNGIMWYQTGRMLKNGSTDIKNLEDWYTYYPNNTITTNITMNRTNTTPTIS